MIRNTRKKSTHIGLCRRGGGVSVTNGRKLCTGVPSSGEKGGYTFYGSELIVGLMFRGM